MIGISKTRSPKVYCGWAVALASTASCGQQFALKDNTTVVFYGDSITAQRLYTRFAEEFVLTRYPGLHVRFINAGVPGDTTFGGYAGAMPERVQRDVEPFHPAIVTVMLGMNDGGYGYTPEATVHANFLKGYDILLDALEKSAPGATLTLLNPTPYDEITHGTEFAGYSGLVGKISDDVSQISAARHPPLPRVDLHTPLVQALTRAKLLFPQLAPLLIPDRIHPGEAAHWIMASALLSAWHVDPIVSHVRLNASSLSVLEAKRSVVTNVEAKASGLQWTQLDEALPLPLDFNNAMMAVLLGTSSIAQLDQEILTVEGLSPGQYRLSIDKKLVATYSSIELARGVNLALLKTPMWEQARGIDFLEDRRATLDLSRFVLGSEIKATAASVPAEDKLGEAEEELAATVRTKLAPKPHAFQLSRM